MTARITIDPNVRVSGNRTYAGLEDVDGGPVKPGDRVRVWEPESDVSGSATVERVDAERGLVYLDVNWSALRAPATMPPPFTSSAGGRGIVHTTWVYSGSASGAPSLTATAGRLTIS